MSELSTRLRQSDPALFWYEVGGAAALAVLGSILAPPLFILAGVMLAPLQILAVRRGTSALLYAGSGAAVIMLIISTAGADEGIQQIIGRAFHYWAILLIGALWLLNERRLLNMRAAYRLLISSGAAAVIAVPLMAPLLPQLEEFSLPQVDLEQQRELFETVIRAIWWPNSTLLLMFVLPVGAGWWLGTRWGARSIGLPSPIAHLQQFHVDPRLLWPSLVLAATALVAEFAGVPSLAQISWNILAVVMLLYALQGMGIAFSLVQRFNVGSMGRAGVLFALFMLMRGRGIVVPLTVLALLGASEMWVNYRRDGDGERDDQEQGD